ncbi:DUF2971 domain-containing protein [Herbaspirillum sp. alder98]|uniref:DUF2971 domain-containing protein n=1 Tax=Herbaspirillum sp. alder98 TaxID=2913096 RepID=UPI001CD8D48F|nr:DUF2971 domain-containing protein [Herbaspirillum sp. alder98]MCA1326397.1 DUF2971 domain-containing protein [Herbaspirillum sp. alder98]
MDTLYHYTSLNGITGILGSRSIWATHTSFLNDSSEFFHGLSFAKRIASQIFMEDDYLAAFGWAVRDGLQAVLADSLYVASFSAGGDVLSQWRGYCPVGAGVCLGFAVPQVQNFCDGKGYRLEKCIYEHEQQFHRVNSLVEKCFDMFPKPSITRAEYDSLDSKSQVDAHFNYQQMTSEGPGKQQAIEAVTWLCAEVAELVPLFKNEGFHEESEWRIVANKPQEMVKFRANSSCLAPYVELELLSNVAKSALREVIIGPNPNQRRCQLSVEMLLKSNGLTDVDVKVSPLPFTSW